MSKNHNISWLIQDVINESTSIGSDSGFAKVAIPYPPEMAKGFTEHLPTFDGIVLIRDHHQFIKNACPPTIQLGKFSVKFDAPVFVIHIVHSGKIDMHSRMPQLKILRENGTVLFARVHEYDVDQTVYTNEDITTTTLIVPESTIVDYLGNKGWESLHQTLALNEKSPFIFLPLPMKISNELFFTLPQNLGKKMQILYVQSIIIKFLANIKIHITSSSLSLFKTNSIEFKIEDVHHHLMTSHGAIPTLKELGKYFGIAPTKLNALFALAYNESVYSFVSNLRLFQAYQALTVQDLPMKNIAHKVGYSHVNHFIYAFKKKFGMTPGQYRKSLKQSTVSC